MRWTRWTQCCWNPAEACWSGWKFPRRSKIGKHGEKAPVNGVRQCDCEVRHVSLRHLLYAGSQENTELAERVTKIKTKFWIEKEEQDELFQAAKVIMKLLDEQRLLDASSFKTSCVVAQQ
jgi:hypothetical protein